LHAETLGDARGKEATMQRLLVVIAAGTALAAAGVAVAKGLEIQAVKQVGATFTATTVANSSTRTCTNADGTFVVTRAEYIGTASSSEPTLSGPLRLNVESLINTTKNLGLVSGRLRIDTSSSRDTSASLQAVYANGQIHGLVSGRVRDPSASLVGDLSSAFSATGGFTSGKLGGTDGGGAAVRLQRGDCRRSQTVGVQRVRARGAVTAVSSTSITVAGVTCAVPAALARRLTGIVSGDVVEIRCELQNGTLTLSKLDRKRAQRDDDD
jgi:hypothetical protein